MTHGRPFGVTVDPRGALIVADDLSNTIWRVTPTTPVPVPAAALPGATPGVDATPDADVTPEDTTEAEPDAGQEDSSDDASMQGPDTPNAHPQAPPRAGLSISAIIPLHGPIAQWLRSEEHMY